MRTMKLVEDLAVGEWYWRDGIMPVRCVKRNRWLYFVGGSWTRAYLAAYIMEAHVICGPIERPAEESLNFGLAM